MSESKDIGCCDVLANIFIAVVATLVIFIAFDALMEVQLDVQRIKRHLGIEEVKK